MSRTDRQTLHRRRRPQRTGSPSLTLALAFALGLALSPLPVAPVAAAPPELAAPGPQAAAGAEPATPPAEELARIRAALERMVELMEQQAGDRRAGLALQRLDVENERVARLENRLSGVRDTRSSVEDEKLRLEERFRLFERHQGADLSEEERLRARGDLNGQLQLFLSRLDDLDRQAVELANRLADRRRQVEEWEAVVEGMLQE